MKDVDFKLNQIIVRDGKGAKDRVTVLPENVKPGLKSHLERVKMKAAFKRRSKMLHAWLE